MQKTSGFQPKSAQALSMMDREQLLERLGEVKRALDNHALKYKKVFGAADEAQDKYDMAWAAKIEASKSIKELEDSINSDCEVSMQTKMEATRLQGIEIFAEDTRIRAKEYLAEKEQDRIDVMEEGFAIATELNLIKKAVSVLEEKEREAATFNNPLVHNHMTHNN